ncbi:transmembrane protein 125 [Clupea harengus]|uniref:Transmembrane protein 125 n=1 Tax=Clupea harengus TaxID=7950 RepID=A0A6P3VJG4_CLUHA|nr:transmembrane protein 125 [Clupea harengus]
MAEMERLSVARHGRGPLAPRRSDPAWVQRRTLEEQVELWWFGEPRVSLLCYGASVGLVLGLGLAGIGLLSTASAASTGRSAVWRLGVGSALCLLALAVLLKQLLSSAVQDMGCVRSRRRVELLRSGGRLDTALLLAAGLGAAACGATLLGLGEEDTLLPGALLLACGGAIALGVGVYAAVGFWQSRRDVGRRRRRRRSRRRRMMVTNPQPWRDSASSQASLI